MWPLLLALILLDGGSVTSEQAGYSLGNNPLFSGSVGLGLGGGGGLGKNQNSPWSNYGGVGGKTSFGVGPSGNADNKPGLGVEGNLGMGVGGGYPGNAGLGGSIGLGGGYPGGAGISGGIGLGLGSGFPDTSNTGPKYGSNMGNMGGGSAPGSNSGSYWTNYGSFGAGTGRGGEVDKSPAGFNWPTYGGNFGAGLGFGGGYGTSGRGGQPGYGAKTFGTEPVCQPGCLNGGTCVAAQTCQCPYNTYGSHCEFVKKTCPDAPSVVNARKSCLMGMETSCNYECREGYTFFDGSRSVAIYCDDGQWIVRGSGVFNSTACQANCQPACQNGGVCISPNSCQCPPDVYGPYCQLRRKPCDRLPPPMNSRVICNPNSCTVTCVDGHKFPDGSTVANVICRDGEWTPAQKEWDTLPDCAATCTPECLNGGICLGRNYCQCPDHFRGPQCQFKTDICSPQKLGFNGGYKCNGDGISYNCTISCPRGLTFEYPPAPVYVCPYDLGMFLPQKVPSCQPDRTIESELDKIFQTTAKPSFPHKMPTSGTCFMWKKDHYKTFDGKLISFKSDCIYTLVSNIDNTFHIQTPTVRPGCNPQVMDNCVQIRIFINGKQYILTSNEYGQPVIVKDSFVMRIPIQLPGLRAEMGSHYVRVSMQAAGVSLIWDLKDFVEITVSESQWNKTAGLCGRLDGFMENDLSVAHESLQEYASLSRVDTIGQICQENIVDNVQCDTLNAIRADEFCTNILSNKKFDACRRVVPVVMYYEACKWDNCACPPGMLCGCDSIAMFVRECKARGVHIPEWRDGTSCPMTCSGDRVYMACGKEATCGGAEKDGGVCEEGCFCPEGTFLSDNKCVRKEHCSCHLQGKLFPPGHVIVKECNTCKCNDGGWVCTAKECESRCEVIGDPHYTTFDKKSYDFMGKCSYYLLKTDEYSIEAENVPCDGSISENMGYAAASLPTMASCTKSVTIRLGETVIKLKQAKEVTVNGEDQLLPVSLKHAYIRQASSIFVQVELSDGIEVWWDGETRVYIHAPAKYKGHTKGLCGTFNGNQRDDFLTPEGDIEQNSVSFANKWKTKETCDNKVVTEIQNPCDVNVQNKATAIKYCSHITSKLFEECHLLMYPDKYYDNCLYDMCSCNGDISKCLCPIIAAYAKECAHQGVQIKWRPEVRECGIQCPRGQQFQMCGDSCARSCQDLSRQKPCTSQCVEGCNCPLGLTLDHRGQCIPIAKCPCIHNGVEYPAGHKEIRSTAIGKELCTCVNAIWNCKKAGSEDIKKYPDNTQEEAACSAEKNKVYSHCEPSEPITCQNMHENKEVQHSEAVCYGGCVCKMGYILDSITKECVLPNECPCHHGGKSYTDGEQIQEECNTCMCNSGKWSCTDHTCPGICTAWGDAHFKTFDDKIYDFQGSCEYIFSEGKLSEEDKFNIVVEVVPCGSSGVSCSKAVTLSVGVNDKQETVVFSDNSAKPANLNLKRISIREAGLFIFADVPDLGLVLQWDKGTRVSLRADGKWKSKLKGLCGNYNHDSSDDFQTPGGGGVSEGSAHLFGDSWKLHAFCPEAKPLEDTCEDHPGRKQWAVKKCGALKSSLFKPCHSEVPVEPYLKRCIYDTCGCDQGGDCECLCTALSAYAQECNAHGVHIKWRSQELCPIQCDETCSEYNPCVQTCPPETCDNIIHKSKLPSICSEDTCVEGCKLKPCPEGQIYQNATDMKCIPTESCKPPCMIDGKEYKEGELIDGDGCYSCYCTRDKKVCSGQPCAVTSPKPEEANMTCEPGWSPWINKHHPSPPSFLDDIETLPTLEDFGPLTEPTYGGRRGLPWSVISCSECVDVNWFQLTACWGRSSCHDCLDKTGSDQETQCKRSPVCTEDMMVDIECRTVEDHRPSSEMGENVECSLAKGLECKNGCHDYELRVLCYCGGTTIRPASTTPQAETLCDVRGPLKEHKDCSMYYQCQETMSGPEWIERNCAPSTFFNPETMMCEWIDEVLKIRPECEDDSARSLVTPGCPYKMVVDDCAISCHRLCHFYGEELRAKAVCGEDAACVKGCAPLNKTECPRGYKWRDETTCVRENDCTCKSHTGEVVKPGTVVQESDCEFCQCLENHYVCDKSACTTIQPSVHITKTIVHPAATTGTVIIIPTVVTAPEKCDQSLFVPLLPDLPDSAISASSSALGKSFEPHNARLSSPEGIWKPAIVDNDQYLEIDLGKVDTVYGVATIGNPQALEFVNSYHVLYSTDNNTYSFVSYSGMPELFFGPAVGSGRPLTQVFSSPVEARYIRINPVSWTNEIVMKVEVYGCAELTTTPPTISTTTVRPVCTDKMSAKMSDRQVAVSSSLLEKVTADLVSVTNNAGWEPKTSNPNEWIEFDFVGERTLTGIVTLGGGSDITPEGESPGWVVSYAISYGQDEINWNPVVNSDGSLQVFQGNSDNTSPHANFFDLPIRARYLRLMPLKWHNRIALRLQALGCYEPYPEIETTTEKLVITTTPAIFKECNICPGAKAPDTCPCTNDTWWDGEQCTTRTLCPCFIGFISYATGSIFDNENCEQCICVLNGIAQCKPKHCPPCEEDLQSVINKVCGCECKPCPEGQRLCPTSNVCVSKEVWCDGFADCPDDERSCPTSPPPISRRKEITQSGKPPTTPPPAPVCPPVKCPPSTYPVEVNVNETENVGKMTKSEWSPFGGKSKWGTYFAAAKLSKGKNKGHAAKGRKGGPPSILLKNKPMKLNNCPQFICKPMRRTSPIKDCPKPECEPGFILDVKKSNDAEVCDTYSCIPEEVIIPDGKCNVTGRSFETFDGMDYKYDICDHILARDLINKAWEIKQIKKCSYVGPCLKFLVVIQGNHTIQFNPDLSIEFDNYNYTVSQMQKIGAQSQEFAIKQVSNSYIIFTSIYDFSVIWDSQGNTRIIVPGSSLKKVDGLCGFFDGKRGNDKRQPDGKQAKTSAEFGDSWGDSSKCEVRVCPVNIQNKAWEMCKEFREGPLAHCDGVVHLTKLISQCVESICNCLEHNNDTEACRCQAILDAVTECQSRDSSVDLSQWRYIHDCSVQCPDGLVYKECFNYACETSCNDLMVEGSCPQVPECFPGCYCPDGLVRDGEKCVRPAECRDCACNNNGHSSYNTFDHADFMFGGNCTYVLSKTINGANGHQFEVLGTGKPCTFDPSETCIDVITILIPDHSVQLINDQNKKTIVKVDEAEIETLPVTESWISVIETPGKFLTVSLLKLQLDLEFYGKGKGFYLKIPSQLYNGKTEGLCGNCNMNTTDDFKMRNGTILMTDDINSFASSWLVEDLPKVLGEEEKCTVAEPPPECMPPPEAQDPCMKLLDQELFGQCHAVVDPTTFVENCHMALCKEVTVTCPFLESYARECQNEGICLNWRTPDLCPYHCPPGLVHQPCGTGCTPTCENYELYKETPSACTATPGDTCLCPEGKVLENGTCIEEKRCKPCDEEGHYPGDKWNPDTCTTCTCNENNVECSRITCNDVNTLCQRGYHAIIEKGTEENCCPTHICVPEPAGPECPEPQQPHCGYGQIMKLETAPSGCQEFICQCKPIEDCEDITPILSKERLPGMQTVVDNTGCCPKVDIVCKVETCPKPPNCSEFHEPIKKDTEHCCPEYVCEIPEHKCLYEMQFKEGEEGGEKPREPGEKIKVLLDLGDIWNDGPCRSCECKEGVVQGSCTTKHCSQPPESDTYVYKSKYLHHKCCPIYEKVACKMDGKIYEPGTVWPSPNGDPCTNFTCDKGMDEELTRLEAVETCKKECPLGWKYVEPAADSHKCCGECKPTGCVVDGVVHLKDSSWTSPDNCTTYYCDILSNDQTQVITSQEQCPDISDCPPERIFQDHCCKKCNATSLPQSLCTPEPMPLDETIRLIKVPVTNHGICVNLEHIPEFNECIGDCKSSTKYNRETGQHESVCKCCQATKYTVLDIKVTCEDEFQTVIEMSVPSECSCTSCIAEGEQKIKSKKNQPKRVY